MPDTASANSSANDREREQTGPGSDELALERLIALTRAALDAISADDVEQARALDVQRRECIAALRGDSSQDPRFAELARQARALDAKLTSSATRWRDELDARASDLPALKRATRGYADTDALSTPGPHSR